MKIKKEILLLGLIVLVGLILRLWQLGQIPISPDWDEVSLGYNAYSVMLTGKDEYGKFLPIVLQSFNDYKPALYMYLIVPFIKILGLTVFAVRLPSVIMGIIAILATYFIVDELFEKKKLALVSSFLLAISPWSIQFSRVAFESNTGLTFNLLLILFFLKSFKRPLYLVPSAIFAGLNLYVYQADKVFTPILVLILTFVYRKQIFSLGRKYILTAIVLGAVIALPMITYTFTTKGALSRAQGASILQAPIPLSNLDLAVRNLVDKKNHDIFGFLIDNRRIIYAKEIIGNYFWHYNPNWLFIQGEGVQPFNPPLRHQATGMGNLYLFDLPFLLIGIYLLFFGDFKKTTKLLIFLWFLAVPIPASITWDVPNSVRTLNFLPTFQIFIGLGVLATYEFISRFKFKYFALILIGIFGIFNFIYYLDQYFVQYNYFASAWWQYGYTKLIPQVQNLKGKYSKVIVSSKIPLDQSYMFFLFYLKYSPDLYRIENPNVSGEYTSYHRVGDYEFKNINLLNEPKSSSNLYVVGADDLTTKEGEKIPVKIVYTINFLDGSPAFELVEKN